MKKLLLPIRPKYVKQIFAGTKRFEYRKRLYKDSSVEKVLIYQSSDVRMIVGEFRILGVVKGSPSDVWNQTSQNGGISKDEFFEYFKKCDVAYAYKISDLVVFDKKIPLSEIGLKKAPMSYQYVNV